MNILKKSNSTLQSQNANSHYFSKLNYCNNLYIDLPQYQIQRMIKLQKSCVGFIKCNFSSTHCIVIRAIDTRMNR